MWYIISLVAAFYIPGMSPRTYQENDTLEVKVDKLISDHTEIPYDYYELNFCKEKVRNTYQENIGQHLSGDFVTKLPYNVNMNVTKQCELLCSKQNNKEQVSEFKDMISNDYRAQWILDNLPAGVLRTFIDQGLGDSKVAYYENGFPIGFQIENSYYINNHVNLHIKINPKEENAWRVVGFLVEPLSIEGNQNNLGCDKQEFIDFLVQSQELKEQIHDPYTEKPWENQFRLRSIPAQQVAENITYSYSVIFEESDIEWASRWDNYLYMKGDSNQIHWLAIINSIVMVLILSGVVLHILQRMLNRDIRHYNERADLEIGDDTGWKQVHGDVFRPPIYSQIFAILIGSGVQLVCMAFITLVFSTIGFLSPAQRGQLLTTMLILYTFMGIFAGYIQSRLNKMFGNLHWKVNTILTALLIPGGAFSVFFIINICLELEGSSEAVSFTTLLKLLFLWLGISLPLIYVGSLSGFKKEEIANPCKINRIPRMIPLAADSGSLNLISLAAGALPFGCMLIEITYVMQSMWHHFMFYYLFGFLFMCFIILIITSSEVAILVSYLLLCKEDYRWWWTSFLVPGISGGYLFVYGVGYFLVQLQLTRLSSLVFYFGYMGLISAGFALITGTVGFLATFVFIRKIYSLIKID